MRQSEVKEIGKNRKRVFARKLEQIVNGQMTIAQFLDKSFIKPQLFFIAYPYVERAIKRLQRTSTRGQRIDVLDQITEKLENFNKEYHYVIRTKSAIEQGLIRSVNGVFKPSAGMMPYIDVETLSPSTYKVVVLSTNVYFICNGEEIIEESVKW